MQSAFHQRRLGIYNTMNDLCNNVCVPNKTEDLNLKCVQHDYRNKLHKSINKANGDWTLRRVMGTKFDLNVSNEMLLNAARWQGYCFYCF